ncbi:ParA family protein [Heliorestis acidaminivorans]|nr:AAA family ATPase [Heliorestis acidaminivorans]
MAKKLFFGNYKGGVGKTTSVFQIATWMATKGRRVLLLDLDPQCSLSSLCTKNQIHNYTYNSVLNYAIELYCRFINNNVNDFDLYTMNIQNQQKYIKNIIRNLKNNLDYIPSSFKFKNARLNDLASKMSKNVFSICIIPLLIRDLELEQYDYILFDCPPTSNTLIHSVFMASDYYIIPTIGDNISGHGVPDYITEIENVYVKYAMNDEIGGLMLTSLFGEKPLFIGVFETIYKDRRGTGNINLIKDLDLAIDKLNIPSLLSDAKYGKFRYNKQNSTIETKHIFQNYTRHLVDIVQNTEITVGNHPEYEEITDQIITITS